MLLDDQHNRVIHRPFLFPLCLRGSLTETERNLDHSLSREKNHCCLPVYDTYFAQS